MNTLQVFSTETLPPLTARSRNLVRFGRHLPEETMDLSFAGDFAFRDAGSRFSLLKSHGTEPGPDECYGLFARDARLLFSKLLGLSITYEGVEGREQERASNYNAINYYRSHVVEHFCHNGMTPLPPTEGECVFWFAAPDLLCIRYRIFNKAAVEVPVSLQWNSECETGDGYVLEPISQGFSFANTCTVNGQTYQNRAELLSEEQDLVFTRHENRVQSNSVSRVIPPHGVLTCRFAVRFAFNQEAFPSWDVELWNDSSLTSAIAETESAYQRLPQLPEGFAGHQDLAIKAVGTLRTLRYRDYDQNHRPCMTIHVGKTGCAATYFWDSATTFPALALISEREVANGALRLPIDGIKEDGTQPLTYEHQKYVYDYQMPILAWSAGHYLATLPDATLLAEIYGPLCRYVRNWLANFRTAEGLVVHPPGPTCLDDTLRWHEGSPLAPRPGQPWHEHRWGNMAPETFACPDVSTFLVLEMRTLAEMADALGKPDEAANWRLQAMELADAINRWLIEPTTRTYQDRQVKTGEFNGMIQFGSFLPLYDGIAPPEIAEVMCRDYLLSPAHFLTPLPFPVVDRAHPTFRSGGFLHTLPEYPGSLIQQAYWRGRTWPHVNNWYLGALWKSGFEREADRAADQILTAMSRSEGINECYDSLTGFGNGHTEFMWSSAAVLLIANQFYRGEPVAKLTKHQQ